MVDTKKMIISTIVIAFVAIIIITAFLSCIGFKLYIDTTKDKETIKIEKDIKQLEIYDVKREGKYITGYVKNTLDYDLNYIAVNAFFYNRRNEILNNSLDNISFLKQNEKWHFKILVLDEFESYKVLITDIQKAKTTY
jgi:hypothetical protein